MKRKTIISGYTDLINLTSSFHGVYSLTMELYKKEYAPKDSKQIKIILYQEKRFKKGKKK